jgi:hypothetical protein
LLRGPSRCQSGRTLGHGGAGGVVQGRWCAMPARDRNAGGALLPDHHSAPACVPCAVWRAAAAAQGHAPSDSAQPRGAGRSGRGALAWARGWRVRGSSTIHGGAR